MGLDARKLDREVTLLRVAKSDDGFSSDAHGEPQDLGKCWMSKHDASDGERLRAAEFGASVTARCQARWDSLTSSMTTQDRLGYGGVVYEIIGTKELGRRDGIEFTTKAAQP